MSDAAPVDGDIACFLDTNVLLHFQTFDEVEWASVLDASSVCLMIAPLIFRELSDHKDEASNERRQKRARDILRKLEKVLPDDAAQAGRVRHRVTIREIPQEPGAAWSERGLDPQIQDDRLIASILDYKAQHPSAEVRLLTGDVPLRRKAKHHGIRVVDPADKLEPLPFAASPTEIENHKLKQELQALKQRSPQLAFGFMEDGRLVNKVARPMAAARDGAPTDEQIAVEVEQLRAKLGAVVSEARGRIDDQEIEEYVLKCREFLNHLHLARKMQRSKEYGPTCQLTFALTNSGGAPANDVSLQVEFPEGSFVVAVEDARKDDWGTVVLPDEPVARWTRHPTRPNPLDPYFTANLGSLWIPPRTSSPPAPPVRRGPLYDFDGDRSIVWFRDTKMPQDSSWPMPTVVAYLPPSTKRGFTIRYTLRADELPKAVTGSLHVVWRAE